MAITYFGNNTDGTTSTSITDRIYWNNAELSGFTCPGSGSQSVLELGVRCSASGAANIRLAIYSTAGNLLMQGNAEMAAPDTAGWISHTSFVDYAGDPIISPTLTGGTNYILALTTDDEIAVRRDAGVTGDWHWYSGDETGGFAATLHSANDTSGLYCVRCGVEPAAGGPSLLIIQHYNRMMRQD